MKWQLKTVLMFPILAFAYETERINVQELSDGNRIEWKVTKRGYQSRLVRDNLDGSTTKTYGCCTRVRESKSPVDGSITRTGDLKRERALHWD